MSSNHGDLHHENVMRSPERGWVVIDPKCLYGERTYDVANTFYNPLGSTEFAKQPAVIQKRCEVYSRRLGLDPRRALEYAFAHGCLSAAWYAEDGQSPDEDLTIARSIHSLLN